ncbi:hypothetical protein QFC22_006391 [Naganishia vaughanmartiniae]|uniref:Uncharacterized protein n=1 Tax=Naganishia vaughanmartiniae TaxID=1424756 RepID=A0ACC2WMP4_9TREE|nr:hypothetical protein QFC22_006391 [Naganishia vaughanmartiniae]
MTAAPLPPARARTVSNIPPPEPQLYVYRRNPTSLHDAYFAIPLQTAENETPYSSIVKQTPGPDPYDLIYQPPLNVKARGRKECVTADIAPFQGYLDITIPFSPDVPVACHYGSRHLVVLCRNGSLLFVQDYKTTFSLSQSERAKRIFTLNMPSDGPEYWNLAVHHDVAYITTVSKLASLMLSLQHLTFEALFVQYHDRQFDPWANLIAIDLSMLRSRSPSETATDGKSQDSIITGEIDVRSWNIPEPSHLASTHSLQVTSEGVYMPVRIEPSAEHHPDDEFYVDDVWRPPNYGMSTSALL